LDRSFDLIATNEQERRLRDLIEPEAVRLGFDLVRVRVGGGKRLVLQIMAERAGGGRTDVEDCATLSRAVSALLDERDPISDAFTLEVSTPGIDRPLTRPGDFARWEGHEARVELKIPAADGRRRFRGEILAEEGSEIVLALADTEEEVSFGWHEIAKASLVLTDALIDAAREANTLPPQPDEETGAVEGLEVEAVADADADEDEDEDDIGDDDDLDDEDDDGDDADEDEDDDDDRKAGR
jgi:ribosome maturation factor RimP